MGYNILRFWQVNRIWYFELEKIPHMLQFMWFFVIYEFFIMKGGGNHMAKVNSDNFFCLGEMILQAEEIKDQEEDWQFFLTNLQNNPYFKNQ